MWLYVLYSGILDPTTTCTILNTFHVDPLVLYYHLFMLNYRNEPPLTHTSVPTKF